MDLMTPQTAARVMNRYAHQYNAGAFATPTASDMAGIIARGGWHEAGEGVCYTSAWMKRESKRVDWTGRRYTIPAGTEVITHLAVEPDMEIPDLSGYGRIYSYIEDRNLTRQLRAQGREVCAIRISAASEIIACWGRPGSEHVYQPWDYATLTQATPKVDGDLEAAQQEAAKLSGWLDDFPFYSDGSWSALSLRGFKADDPTWGIKPSEMNRAWKREHMDALGLQCKWTVLAQRCQAIVNMVNRQFQGRQLERVRLLRMTAPKPGKVSRLSRHTDITDRGAGTHNGQIMRFHIPLLTHPDSRMMAWRLDGTPVSHHLSEGEMWYLDARKPHAVAHAGPSDRIHLVVDVLADSETRRVVTSGWEAHA